MGRWRALGWGLLAGGLVIGCTRDNPDYMHETGTPDAEVTEDAGLDAERLDGEAAGGDLGPDIDAVDPDRGVGVDLGEVDARTSGPVDDDGDGVPDDEDCDDGERAVFPGAPERCNGIDDDCDEAIDEGWAGLGAPCVEGLGACRVEGVRVCVDEARVGCDATPPPAGQELCNGVDDDCDGTVDEAVNGCCLVGDERPCGSDVGACRVGVQICGRGSAYGPCLDGVMPAAERCDGVDIDCDGTVDEGFETGSACTAGVGACARAGVTICTDDGEVACDAAPVGGSPEVCDGVDDDCDGAIDEGFDGLGAPCAVGIGACAREGQGVCGPDGVTCDAMPGPGADEVCNGIDDDCDGAVDESVGGGMPCAAGEGACRREGLVVCDAAGAVECDAMPGEGSDERCNGIDDDCDGAVDEAFPTLGDACVVRAGGCEAPGALGCDAEGGVACQAPPVEGVDEVCNGLDDDCDGAVDEGLGVGEPCFAGIGACRAEGRGICVGGALGCDAEPGVGGDEVCDGIDDDCDGMTDEGFGLGEPCTAGIGACVTPGRLVCGPDGAVCDAAPGMGRDEVCDGVDDDCDGVIDEGVANACGGCGPAPDEVCDAIDDDCDGQVDEGLGLCIVLLGSTVAPDGAAGFGVVLAAAGDVDGDGVSDALVGAPEGPAGQAAVVSGADASVVWAVADGVTFGASVAAGDVNGDGVRELFVGAPGIGEGVVVQLDPAGGEVRRLEGGGDFRAGRALVAADGAPWIAMGDRDARATFFGPAGALRFVTFGEGVVGEVTLEGEAGEALGDRLFIGPRRGAALPDVVATVEDLVDRSVRLFVDPPAGGAGELLEAPFTNGSFGEGFAYGRLLAGEPEISVFGAPLAGNRQAGGVYLYDGDGLPIGGLVTNGGRGDRQGFRLAVLPRAERDALILAGEAASELRVWEMIRSVDGRAVIASSTPVRVDGAQDGFGKGLVIGDAMADGTRRLFVGEPGAAGGGRVYVFSVR